MSPLFFCKLFKKQDITQKNHSVNFDVRNKQKNQKIHKKINKFF